MKKDTNNIDPELRLPSVDPADLKRNAFSTPDGYFEELTPRIMQRVRTSTRPPQRTTPYWPRLLRPMLPLVGLAVIGWVLFLMPSGRTGTDFDSALASFTAEEISLYTDADAEELISTGLVSATVLQPRSTGLSDEDILDFLTADEELDWNTITDELDI